MGLKGPLSTSIDDRATNSSVDALATSLGVVLSREILDGVLVKGIAITAGTVSHVAHGLQRTPLGWVLARKRATADVWDSQDSNDSAARTLALNASANVTVDLWIF